MSDQFLNSYKLATLSEFRYLLLEVLDREDPIPWYDLSFSCKEMSLNFAFSFENSITFLQLISLVNINVDRSVSRAKEKYEGLSADQNLAMYILQKTFTYLEKNKRFGEVFNKNTIIVDHTLDMIFVQPNGFPADLMFIRSLLLNLIIIAPDKDRNGKLPVNPIYKAYFQEELLPKFLNDPPPKITTSAIPNSPSKIPMIFISYAFEDMKFKNELQNHLSGLKRKQLIKDWEGRAILPGEEWEDEIRQKLEQAEIVLFLVSSDFLASDYIHDVEIKNTIERHSQGKVRIIPIIIRPCDFKSLVINRYQALPDGAKAISLWQDKDEAYLNIVNGIREVLTQMSNHTN